MATTRTTPTLWAGPIAFGAIMISVAGLFNVISGLAAVFADDVYVTAPGAVLLLDVTGWGWVHFLFGIGLVVTGVAILVGQEWARIVGAALVALNMTTQLLLMPAYPFWAVVIIALDALVLWALLVHTGVAAVGGWHGGGLVTDAADSPHLALATARAAFAFGHADHDRSMPPEAVAALGEALDAAGLEAVNEVFPGPHGYSMADTSSYDEESAERHFESLQTLLTSTLGR